jgi:cytochrome P450
VSVVGEPTLSVRAASFAVAEGRLPGIGHAFAMRRPLRFLCSLQRQADIVRVDLGPMSTLFLTAPDLINSMLVDRRDNYDKGRFYDKVRPLAGNGVVLAQGAEHRRQLAMIKPAFHRGRLGGYTEVMHEVVAEKLADWRSGQELQIDKEMHTITLRILARTMFGAGIGSDAAGRLATLLPDVLKAIMVRTLDPGDLLARLPLPVNRRFNRAHAALRGAIREVMLSHRDGESGGADILSTLLDARDEVTGEPMTEDEICDQIVAVTMAGSETAATAMAWMFHELGRHPEIVAAVRAEIDSVLGDRRCELGDVGMLPYCRRVLQEVLRLRQPIMVISRRTTTEVPIGGGVLRAGTELFYSPYAVFRDPVHFPDPMSFAPDRWLTTPAHLLPRGTYTPFGGGPRHCIGEHFAWAMMTVVLTEVVRNWTLRPKPGARVREMPWATINPSSMPMVPTRAER